MNKNVLLVISISFCCLFASCGVKDPVLYPNAKYNKIGKAKAEAIAAECEEKAVRAGIKKDKSKERALKRGAVGTVAGAAAGAAGTAIYGGKVGRGTAAGAVGGGIWGALTGMFNEEEPNPTYRNYVDRCIRERGLDIIGWD